MEISKIIILIIGILLIVIPVHIMIVGYISYNIIFKRGKKVDFYKVINDKYFAKYKEELIKNYKWYSSLEKEEIALYNKEGILLKGYLTKNKNNINNVIVIYSHGWHSEGFSDIGRMGASLLYREGYDILVIDHEAHGKSLGSYTTFGIRDSDNIKLWIDKINELYNNNCKIILTGMSMGANAILLLANKNMKNVKMIIADCGFTSVYEEMKYSFVYRLKLGYIRFLEFYLFCLLNTNINILEKDARIALKRSKYPILLIHGRCDKVVPVSMTKENYYACSTKKELLIVDNADHALSSVENKDEYEYRVIRFINENLKGDS